MSTPQQAAEELGRLAKALKDAGNNDLRKELLAGLRKSGAEAIVSVKAGIYPTMPNRGGFAALLHSSSMGVRNSLSGRRVGVRVAVQPNKVKQIDRLDREGRLRAPTFGNRSSWHNVYVRPGFVTEVVEDEAPDIAANIRKVILDVGAKIERKV